MEVILLERIEKLGNMGDIVLVKSGYARNYLIPNNKCLRATEENKKYFSTQKEELEQKNLTKKKEAEALLSKVSDFRLDIIKTAGEAGHLYGSVKAQDIAKYLSDNKFIVDKSQVIIHESIKTIGVFKISVKLHPEITTSIFANVSRSKDECNNQFNLFLESQKKAQSSELPNQE